MKRAHCIDVTFDWTMWEDAINTGLILGLHPANERQRYFATKSLIRWAQT